MKKFQLLIITLFISSFGMLYSSDIGNDIKVQNFTSAKASVDKGVTAFNVNATFTNVSTTGFIGALGVVLTDLDGNILETIGIYNMRTPVDLTISSGVSYPCIIVCCVSKVRSVGNYRIRAAARLQGSSDWILLSDPGKDLIVTDSGNIFNIKTENLWSTRTSICKETRFGATAVFKNTGAADFYGLCGVALVDDQDEIVAVVGTNRLDTDKTGGVSIPAGVSFVGSFGSPAWYPFIPESVPPGNYKLRAAVMPANGDWYIVKGESGAVDVVDFEVKPIPVDLHDYFVYGHLTLLTSSVSTVETGVPFTFSTERYGGGTVIYPDYGLFYTRENTINVDYAVALLDGEGGIAEIISTPEPFSFGRFAVKPAEQECIIPTTVPSGRYFLSYVVKEEGAFVWKALKMDLTAVGLDNVVGLNVFNNNGLTVIPAPIHEDVKLTDKTVVNFSVSSVEVNNPFTFSTQYSGTEEVEYGIYNTGTNDITLNYAVALIDAGKQIVSIVSEPESISIDKLTATSVSGTCIIPKSVTSGRYYLCLVADNAALRSSNNNDDWSIIAYDSFDLDKTQAINVVNDGGVSTMVDMTTLSDISVYPNPVKDVLSVENREGVIRSLKITDLSGRLLKSISFAENTKQAVIPVAELKTGTYIIVIQTENDVVADKMIKM